MLTLTENASTVVKSITDQTTAEESAGLRITADGADASALNVAPSEAALPGDKVVEEGGARLFLSEDAAQSLEDKILDAEVDESGGVQFMIGIQA